MNEHEPLPATATSDSNFGILPLGREKPAYKAERKTHSRKRRLLSALTATALVAGGVIAFEKFQDRRHSNNAVTSEMHGIEKGRLTPQQNRNRLIALREGAVYSESSEKVGDRLFGLIKGNTKVVAKGSVVLLSVPTEATIGGKTIYGAAQQPAGCAVIESEDFVSSSVIASRMNTYALADQGSRNDQKLVEEFTLADPLATGDTVEALYNSQGQMRAADIGKVVACATEMQADVLAFFLETGGIVPNK